MNIVAARRVSTTLVLRPNNTWARAGIRYETRAHKALAANPHCLVLHNPQFTYTTTHGTEETHSYCIPDFLLSGLDFLPTDAVIVLECKLTYKPEAAEKLTQLYVPVLQRALRTQNVLPIIVAKTLTPAAPEPHMSVKTAVLGRLRTEDEAWKARIQSAGLGSVPVVQWLGRGEFPIGAGLPMQPT